MAPPNACTPVRRRLTLAPGSIDLWRIDLDAGSALEARAFSTGERARASRFAFERDRVRYLRARHALRALLAAYEDRAPEALDLREGAHGKPFLANGRHAFNASHAGDVALVAVAHDRAVGVDVETRLHRGDLLALAGQVFDERECADLASRPADARLDAFLTGWTRKEAVLKALGLGLTVDPRRLHAGLDRARLRAQAGAFVAGSPDFGVDVETVDCDGGIVVSVASPQGWSGLRRFDFQPVESGP